MYLDKYKIRDTNERIVLEALITNQPVSRVDLSKITKLNKASITNIINSLIDKKLVHEIGYGESQNSGGRRPILLNLNKEAGYALSIDVGNTYISAIVTDLNGLVVHSVYHRDLGFEVNEDNIYDYIDKIVENAEKIAKDTTYGIVALAVAIHGVVHENKILTSPNYNLTGVNLHETLVNKYSFPVLLENEANLALLGQISLSPHINNALLLSIHTGIGAGVITERNLYLGNKGAAGEVGHMTLYPNGLACRCGRRGCLEQYCSTDILTDELEYLYPNKQIDKDLYRLAYDEHDNFKDLAKKSASDLAIGIQSMIAHFDPDIIYIVSEVFESIPSLIDYVQQILEKDYDRHIPIQISDMKYGPILLGGASLGISEFLGTEAFILSDYEIKNNVN